MLIVIAGASYIHYIYVRVCEVSLEIYRTHRCSVHMAYVCPCMSTAHPPSSYTSSSSSPPSSSSCHELIGIEIPLGINYARRLLNKN